MRHCEVKTLKLDPHPAIELFSPVFLHWLERNGCQRVSYREICSTKAGQGSVEQGSAEPEPGLYAVPVISKLNKLGFYTFAFPQALPLASEIAKTIQQYVAMVFPLMDDTNHAAAFSIVSITAAKTLLHDLRNRLNSLLLNAAVLSAKSAEPALQRFSDQIDVDGQSCAKYLLQFSQLLHITEQEKV